MKAMTMLVGVGMFLAAVTPIQASDVPPRDGMALSAIIKSVEDQKVGVITEVEFDDGLWEVDVHKGSREVTFYLNPKTGKLIRQRDSVDVHETLPPSDGKPLSEIIKGLEVQKVGVISEVECDDGFWEVTSQKDGKKIKMDLDPRSGKIRVR